MFYFEACLFLFPMIFLLTTFRKKYNNKIFSANQNRSKLDNGGGGADIHIFVFCTINFL